MSWLLTEPDTAAYGNAMLNVAMSFAMARALHARVCMRPTDPRRHAALWTLRADDATVIEPTTKSWSRIERLMGQARYLVGGSGCGRRFLRYVDSAEAFGSNPWARRYADLDFRRVYVERPIVVRFASDIEARLPTLAQAIGIDPDRPIVTLHVREASYKAGLGIHQRPKDLVRNASIDSYRCAVQWLIGAGFQVVRIGDPSMRPLRLAGVIDLSALPDRDRALEVWAVRSSTFLIATDCGPMNFNALVGTPCLATNMTNLIGGYPLRSRDLYLPKHLHTLADGRELSLPEMLSPQHFEHRFDEELYRFRDNSDEEIAAAVREMTESVGVTQPSPSARQGEFRGHLSSWLNSEVGRRRSAKGGLPPFYLGEGRVAQVFADSSDVLP